MNNINEETKNLIESLEREGWQPPKASSYQIRNSDGTPGGWVAQVYLVRESNRDVTYQPLMETNVRIYKTKDEADRVALQMGWSWLRRRVA